MIKIYDDKEAACQVLKLYTEGVGGLSPEDQTKLINKGVVTYKQASALEGFLSDGLIEGQEVRYLRQIGLSEKFISELTGPDGKRALESRAKWLGEHINKKLFRWDHSNRDRASMCRELGVLREPGSSAGLIIALKDKDVNVRKEAAIALGEIGGYESYDAIIEALKDPNAEIRREAAISLGKVGLVCTVYALLNSILHDWDASVREASAWALGRIGYESAVFALIKAMDDVSASVRKTSAWALGEIGTERAFFALIEALDDEDADVRATAILALGKIGDKRALPALTKALNDENAHVRNMAAYIIRQIQRRSGIE